MVMENKDKGTKETKKLLRARHTMIDMITQRLESFSLNTVVSGFMESTNNLNALAKEEGGIDRATLETAVTLIAPFAPHLGEELWRELGHTDSVFHETWPAADKAAMAVDEIEVPVQVNGKTRMVITIPADADRDAAVAAGREALGDRLKGTIVKEIYVPKKIINIVVKG